MAAKRCNVAVLASGVGTNFKAIAEACRRDDFPARVACFITDNPDAGALGVARGLGIPAFPIVPPTPKAGLPFDAEREIVEVCRRHAVDLVALAGFMRILKGPLLDAYPGRIMNIHPSLLPSFKGLHSVRQALDYGVKITGCSVHFVDSSVDGGAIILQAAVEIAEDDTEDSLLAKVHAEEHRTYVRAVELFARDRLRIEGRRVRVLEPGGAGPA